MLFGCFYHAQVRATADISTEAGRGSSSVSVRADGKDRVKLDAQVSHSLQRGERTVGLRVNVSQSLLHSPTDLHVNMSANMSSDRCVDPPGWGFYHFVSIRYTLTVTCPVNHLFVNFWTHSASSSVSLHGSYKQGHEALLAQVKGSLKTTQGLQLAVSGDLRHSMANLAVLPPVLGLDGALGQSDTLIEGKGLFKNTN